MKCERCRANKHAECFGAVQKAPSLPDWVELCQCRCEVAVAYRHLAFDVIEAARNKVL